MFNRKVRTSKSAWLGRFILWASASALVFIVPAPSAAETSEKAQEIHAPYGKTVVVAPVPGSPAASGEALINALDEVDVKKTERWLIKLEPGVYDLGEQPLVLEPGVDIEGSGALQTEIVGLGQDFDDPDFSFHKAVVVGADDAELRHLTVRCENTNARDACIVMVNHDASPRLTNVQLLATDPEGEGHWGLRNDDSSPVLDRVDILVANGTNNYALVNTFSGSRPKIKRSRITAQDGTGDNIGILNKLEALPLIRDVEIGAIGGRLAVGVQTIDTEELEIETRAAKIPTLKMFDVDIAARDAHQNFGVLGGRFMLRIRGGRVTVDHGSALDVGRHGDVDVRHSELRATDFLAHAGHVRIVATWLRGGGDVLGYGEESCQGVHTDDGVTNACP